MVPEEVAVFLAQFRGTSFDAHQALVHGAGVGHQDEVDVLRQEIEFGTDFGFPELVHAEVEHLLHGFGAMATNQFGADSVARGRRGSPP